MDSNEDQKRICAGSCTQTDCIKIDDSSKGYELSHFCIAHHYVQDLECVLIPEGLIKDRIEKLAMDIISDLEGGHRIAALCVLKGGFKFFADLLDGIQRISRTKDASPPLSIDFIRLKSYVNDASTDSVQVIGLDDLNSLRGQDVLIVEDIIDTGRTIKRLLDYLKQFQPRSIHVASLLVKRTPLSTGFLPHYTGFEIPDKFVVGYALDYNDHFRDLSHICVINEEAIKKYSVKKGE